MYYSSTYYTVVCSTYYTVDSGLLTRYRCLLDPGVDLHPRHPLRVGLVEGLQTDNCALSDVESLVGTKDSEQTEHELQKTEGPSTALLCANIILPSLTPLEEFVSEATDSGQTGAFPGTKIFHLFCPHS
jgi:hypothetical protein